MSGSGRSVPRPTESNVHALSKPTPSMLRAASARLAAPKGGPPARPVGREMPNRVMEYGGHHNTTGWSSFDLGIAQRPLNAGVACCAAALRGRHRLRERPRGDEPDRIRFAYGGNFEGPVTVKTKYDADNFFKSNQKIAAALVIK